MDGPAAGQVEYEQSKNAVEACAKAGAKHIVYSTLDGTGDLVPHMSFKQKGEAHLDLFCILLIDICFYLT